MGILDFFRSDDDRIDELLKGKGDGVSLDVLNGMSNDQLISHFAGISVRVEGLIDMARDFMRELDSRDVDVPATQLAGIIARRGDRDDVRTSSDDLQINKQLAQPRTPSFDGTEDTPWERPTLSDYVTNLSECDSDASEVGELSGRCKTAIAAHSLLGDPDADDLDGLDSFPVVNPATGNLNRNALSNARARRRFADDPDALASKIDQLLESEFGVEVDKSDGSADGDDRLRDMLERALPGRGVTDADVMLVGGSPSKLDVIRKHVYSGPVGKTVNDTYLSHIDSDSVYLTNAVPVYLSDDDGNPREPNADDIDEWLPYLKHELERVRPRVVVAMGRAARSAVEKATDIEFGAGPHEYVPHPRAINIHGDSGEVGRKLPRINDALRELTKGKVERRSFDNFFTVSGGVANDRGESMPETATESDADNFAIVREFRAGGNEVTISGRSRDQVIETARNIAARDSGDELRVVIVGERVGNLDGDPLFRDIAGFVYIDKSAMVDDLPPVGRERSFNRDDALARVRRWASTDGSGDKDTIDFSKFGRAFLALVGPPTNISSFRLLVADVIDGRLVAVPAALRGARDRVDEIDGVSAVDAMRIRRAVDTLLRDADSVLAKSDQPGRLLKTDDEKQVVYGVVMEPETEDTDGNWTTRDEIEDAAHFFMKHFQNVGHEHIQEIEDGVCVVESSVLWTDTEIGGKVVPEGSWVMAVKVDDDRRWQMVKSGEYTGFSIDALARINPGLRLRDN